MAEGHRRRVMDKVFTHGIESLHEHEFLEMCLYLVFKRGDTNPLAHRLIDKFGSLENLCNASEDEIKQVKGAGRATAEFIKLLPLIYKGYGLHTTVKKRDVYETKESIERRCVALLRGSTNERAYLMCFDKARRLIKEVELSEGEPGSVDISLRRIMDAVASTPTASVMLCHNHPSGILKPSGDDFNTTADIIKFLESVNIELIDHLVVVEDRFVSCIPWRKR